MSLKVISAEVLREYHMQRLCVRLVNVNEGSVAGEGEQGGRADTRETSLGPSRPFQGVCGSHSEREESLLWRFKWKYDIT